MPIPWQLCSLIQLCVIKEITVVGVVSEVLIYTSQRLKQYSPCGRRVQTISQNLTNFVKNVKIVEFHYHILNHHEKCIKISTNMPSIGLVIREITVKFKKANTILLSKFNGRLLSVIVKTGIVRCVILIHCPNIITM